MQLWNKCVKPLHVVVKVRQHSLIPLQTMVLHYTTNYTDKNMTDMTNVYRAFKDTNRRLRETQRTSPFVVTVVFVSPCGLSSYLEYYICIFCTFCCALYNDDDDDDYCYNYYGIY